MKRIILLTALLSLPLAAQKPKLALVGLNHDHVWNHLNTILKGGLVDLVGVGETLPDRVQRIQKEETTQGGIRPAVSPSLIFSDWKKMIDQTKPQIVWAFLETNRHLEVVQYCAPRGISIMFEYPLSVTYRDALEIQKLARQHNIQVLTNYLNWSWSAPAFAAKAAVDAGKIGPVWRLSGLLGHGGPENFRESTFLTWLMSDEKNGGGALVDFAAPVVVWALWMKGPPQSVYARVDHLRPTEFNGVDDNGTLIMNYKDGVAIMEGTWDMPAAPTADNQIFGLSGGITFSRTEAQLYKRGPQPAGGGRGALEVTKLPVPPLPPEGAGALAYMVDRLAKKLPLGDMVGLDINVQAVAVFEAARNSIKSGRAIDLSSIK